MQPDGETVPLPPARLKKPGLTLERAVRRDENVVLGQKLVGGIHRAWSTMATWT